MRRNPVTRGLTLHQTDGISMDANRERLRLRAETLQPSQSESWGDVADLLTEIISTTADMELKALARQTLPSVRAAAVPKSDLYWSEVAERRFEAVRQELNKKVARPFGRRLGIPEVTVDSPHSDNASRALLGLPANRHLFGPEIRQAYRRAAATAHPDAGGNNETFMSLVAARDALLSRL